MFPFSTFLLKREDGVEKRLRMGGCICVSHENLLGLFKRKENVHRESSSFNFSLSRLFVTYSSKPSLNRSWPDPVPRRYIPEHKEGDQGWTSKDLNAAISATRAHKTTSLKSCRKEEISLDSSLPARNSLGYLAETHLPAAFSLTATYLRRFSTKEIAAQAKPRVGSSAINRPLKNC